MPAGTDDAWRGKGADRGLSPKQRRFVDEYLVDLNATQAAVRAGYSAKTAAEQGARLLVNVKVSEAIAAAQAKRSERVEITQDMVLQRYWMLATADPNELTQVRRTCCRFCYGASHGYQWRDRAEFVAVLHDAEQMQPKDGSQRLPLPSDDGGYGYDPKLSPHARCPRCDGEGVLDVFMGDTRNLSEPGKLLFAGVKTTQNGIEVKMNDQVAALNAVARHLGMFKDKVVVAKVEDLSDEDLDERLAALLSKTAGGLSDTDARGEA